MVQNGDDGGIFVLAVEVAGARAVHGEMSGVDTDVDVVEIFVVAGNFGVVVATGAGAGENLACGVVFFAAGANDGAELIALSFFDDFALELLGFWGILAENF